MEKDARSLLEKYKKGLCSAAEQALVERWYYQLKDNVKLDENRIDEIGHELWAKLGHQQPAPKIYRLWPRIAMAAAAIVAITLGVWLYELSSRKASGNNTQINVAQVGINDVAPGKNTATITLADGKSIVLSEAKTGVVIGDELKYNDGSIVARNHSRASGAGQRSTDQLGAHPAGPDIMLSATTPRGGTYQITLSDGTRVWLNADSRISFPSKFSGKERKILLNGEAYFEVAKAYVTLSLSKRMRQPFIVESKGQKVEVLGTHFNVNAYNDEANVKTTLLEGSVRVVSSSSIILKPNQQAINNGNEIHVKQVDPELAIAWKNKQFLFESEQIQTIMRMVARWYNVEVIYGDELTKDTFSGGISRFDNLSEVLKSLESTGKIHFRIEGRKVYVTE